MRTELSGEVKTFCWGSVHVCSLTKVAPVSGSGPGWATVSKLLPINLSSPSAVLGGSGIILVYLIKLLYSHPIKVIHVKHFAHSDTNAKFLCN